MGLPVWFSLALLIWFLMVEPGSFLSPHERRRVVISPDITASYARSGLAGTVLFVPQSLFVEGTVYVQKATGSRLEGASSILEGCNGFDLGFRSEGLTDVESAVGPLSWVSPDSAIVQWNATWTPPTAWWLRNLGEAWPGVYPVPVTYNHLTSEQSTFSWSAVFGLFRDAASNGRLRIPLACIEGRSLLRFKNGADEGNCVLSSITEELSYADDLRRAVLRNRRCAADLRLFLEAGRKPPTISIEEWEDAVAKCLAWETVPGSNSLDIEPTSEEEGSTPAVVFLGAMAAVLAVFTFVMAPELLGAQLIGPSHPVAVNDYEIGQGAYGLF